jgi:hypothetical protein
MLTHILPGRALGEEDTGALDLTAHPALHGRRKTELGDFQLICGQYWEGQNRGGVLSKD